MSQVSKYSTGAERQAAYRRRKAQAERENARETGLVPLPAVNSMPGTARWRQALAYAANYVNAVHREMSEYHDDRTERWQESDRGADFRDRVEQMEQLAELIQEAMSDL